MSEIITRSIETPIRTGIHWNDEDKGLITCWENGREKSKDCKFKFMKQTAAAKRDALPMTVYAGGCKMGIKVKKIYGSYHYLAYWQGLRGEDLYINHNEEIVKVCTRTSIKVTFTSDAEKYAK